MSKKKKLVGVRSKIDQIMILFFCLFNAKLYYKKYSDNPYFRGYCLSFTLE